MPQLRKALLRLGVFPCRTFNLEAELVSTPDQLPDQVKGVGERCQGCCHCQLECAVLAHEQGQGYRDMGYERIAGEAVEFEPVSYVPRDR